MSYTRLTIDYLEYWNEEESELGSYLLNENGAIISFTNESLSRICYDVEKCHFLYIYGHGDYKVLRNNFTISKGNIREDNPKLIPLGTCNFEQSCKNADNLLVFARSETNSVTLIVDGILKSFSNSSSTSAQLTAEKPVLEKICIDPNSCNKLVGNSVYMLFSSTSVAEGTTYLGYKIFDDMGNCHSKCDENPVLAETSRGREILLVASSISNMIVLTDINSPNYKSACWLIYDDMRQLTASDNNLVQRYLLALIYFSTNGKHWKRNLDFMSFKHECDWNKISYHDDLGIYSFDGDGAHCNELGQVTELLLNHNNLIGKIVPEIYWLYNLEILDLGNNELNDKIPDDIDHLEKLMHIDLSSNMLHGMIPPDITTISTLITIRFQNNRLTGNVPAFNTSSLAYIEFFGNELKGKIPNEFGHLTSLMHLSFYDNQLTSTIPENITKLTKLQYLDFGLNHLTGYLPSLLLTFPHIHIIWLDENFFSGTLPNAASGDIERLYANDNLLSGSIPSQIANLKNLYNLYLQNNRLSGTFPNELKGLQNLTNLYIHNNDITGSLPFEECDQFDSLESDCDSPQKVLCPCCTSCHGLFVDYENEEECHSASLSFVLKSDKVGEFINLFLYTSSGFLIERMWINMQTNVYEQSMCVSLSDCLRLHVDDFSHPLALSVYSNRELVFEEVVGRKKDYYFGYSSSRHSLRRNACDDLSLCNSLGPVNTTKRELMNKLVRATGLRDFIRNDRNSTENLSLCDWMDYLDNVDPINYTKSELLQRFMLASIYFSNSGESWKNSTFWVSDKNYCDWFGVVCDSYNIVTELNLERNGLRGVLPKEISQLRGLKQLLLSNNNLHGSIPSFDGLINLKILNISNNALEREIPTEIGFLTHLTHIDLSNNKLSNSLPTELARLTKLDDFIVNNNKLSGKIESPIFNLTQLKIFSIGSNYIGGEVSALKDFYQLEVLDLSNNFFTGSLPISTNFGKMRVLRLFGNEFVGSISSSIDHMPFLEKLMIQNNQISGSLPTQIGLLKHLTIFSISYNHLKGRIPTEIGLLQNLQLFHLHSNNLLGNADLFSNPIPSQIADCGNMFRSPAPVKCEGCTTCCNEEGSCLHINATWPGQWMKTTKVSSPSRLVLFAIFLAVLLGSMMVIFAQATVSECFQHYHFVVSKNFQEGSAYRFFLSDSILALSIALVPVFMQLYILGVFTSAADFTSDSNDWQYSLSCQNDSLICDNTKYITLSGRILFAIIIFIFLGKDLLEGIMMICESDVSANLKGMFAGFVVTFITSASVLVSTLYNFSTGISNTDVLKDAVILLFLNSIDEQIYDMLYRFFPEFVETQERNIAESIASHIKRLEGPFGKIQPRKEMSEIRRSGECASDLDQFFQHENFYDEDDEESFHSLDSFVTTKTNLKDEYSLISRVHKLESDLNDMKTLLSVLLKANAGRMNQEVLYKSVDSQVKESSGSFRKYFGKSFNSTEPENDVKVHQIIINNYYNNQQNEQNGSKRNKSSNFANAGESSKSSNISDYDTASQHSSSRKRSLKPQSFEETKNENESIKQNLTNSEMLQQSSFRSCQSISFDDEKIDTKDACETYLENINNHQHLIDECTSFKKSGNHDTNTYQRNSQVSLVERTGNFQHPVAENLPSEDIIIEKSGEIVTSCKEDEEVQNGRASSCSYPSSNTGYYNEHFTALKGIKGSSDCSGSSLQRLFVEKGLLGQSKSYPDAMHKPKENHFVEEFSSSSDSRSKELRLSENKSVSSRRGQSSLSKSPSPINKANNDLEATQQISSSATIMSNYSLPVYEKRNKLASEVEKGKSRGSF